MAINFKEIEKSAEDKTALKNEAIKYILNTELSEIEVETFIRPLQNAIMRLFTEEALQERLENLLIEDETFRKQQYIFIYLRDNTTIEMRVAPDEPVIEVWQSSVLSNADKTAAISISGNLYKKEFEYNSEIVRLSIREDIHITNDDLLTTFWGDIREDNDTVIHYAPIINNEDSNKPLSTLIEDALLECGFKVVDIKEGVDLEIKMLNPFYKGE